MAQNTLANLNEKLKDKNTENSNKKILEKIKEIISNIFKRNKELENRVLKIENNVSELEKIFNSIKKLFYSNSKITKDIEKLELQLENIPPSAKAKGGCSKCVEKQNDPITEFFKKLEGLKKVIAQFVIMLLPMILAVSKKMIDWFCKLISDAITPIVNIVNAIIKTYADFYSMLISGPSNVIANMLDWIGDKAAHIPILGKKLAKGFHATAKSIRAGAKAAIVVIQSGAKELESEVSSVGSSIKSTITPPPAESGGASKTAGGVSESSGAGISSSSGSGSSSKQATGAQEATGKSSAGVSSGAGADISPSAGKPGISTDKTSGQGAPSASYTAPAGVGKKPANVTLGPLADISKVEPALLSNFYAAAEEYGKPLKIEMGYRGDEYQAQLWVRANILNEPGIHSPAKPRNNITITYKGQSYQVSGSGKGSAHSLGQALDVTPTAPEGQDAPLDAFLKKHGLWRPFIRGMGRTKADPPHVQLAGKFGADQEEGAKFMKKLNGSSPQTDTSKSSMPAAVSSSSSSSQAKAKGIGQSFDGKNQRATGPSMDQHFGTNEPKYGNSRNLGT